MLESTPLDHLSTGKIRKKIVSNERPDHWHKLDDRRRALGPTPTGARSVRQECQLFVRTNFFPYFSRTREVERSRFQQESAQTAKMSILFNFWEVLLGGWTTFYTILRKNNSISIFGSLSSSKSVSVYSFYTLYYIYIYIYQCYSKYNI